MNHFTYSKTVEDFRGDLDGDAVYEFDDAIQHLQDQGEFAEPMAPFDEIRARLGAIEEATGEQPTIVQKLAVTAAVLERVEYARTVALMDGIEHEFGERPEVRL